MTKNLMEKNINYVIYIDIEDVLMNFNSSIANNVTEDELFSDLFDIDEHYFNKRYSNNEYCYICANPTNNYIEIIKFLDDSFGKENWKPYIILHGSNSRSLRLGMSEIRLWMSNWLPKKRNYKIFTDVDSLLGEESPNTFLVTADNILCHLWRGIRGNAIHYEDFSSLKEIEMFIKNITY